MPTPSIPSPIVHKRYRNVHQSRAVDLVFQKGDSLGVIRPHTLHEFRVVRVQPIGVRPNERPRDIGVAALGVDRRTRIVQSARYGVGCREHDKKGVLYRKQVRTPEKVRVRRDAHVT